MIDKIRVLFLSANPGDQARLRSERECREIEKEIRSGTHGLKFQLIPGFATRPVDLPDALIRHRPHIVHFSGHGSSTQGIVFEDDYGNSLPADAQALSRLFNAFKKEIRLIFLNTCYSKPQAELLSQMFDYTLGTSGAILDTDAVDFSRTFYSTLTNGSTINEATEAARFVLTAKRAPIITDLLIGKGVDADQSFVEQVEAKTDVVKGSSPPKVEAHTRGKVGKHPRLRVEIFGELSKRQKS